MRLPDLAIWKISDRRSSARRFRSRWSAIRGGACHAQHQRRPCWFEVFPDPDPAGVGGSVERQMSACPAVEELAPAHRVRPNEYDQLPRGIIIPSCRASSPPVRAEGRAVFGRIKRLTRPERKGARRQERLLDRGPAAQDNAARKKRVTQQPHNGCCGLRAAGAPAGTLGACPRSSGKGLWPSI